MKLPAALTVPVARRFDVVAGALVVVAFLAGVGAGLLPRSQTFTHTRTVRLSIRQQYGKPDSSVDGARINAALKGFACDVYQAEATIICHR